MLLGRRGPFCWLGATIAANNGQTVTRLQSPSLLSSCANACKPREFYKVLAFDVRLIIFDKPYILSEVSITLFSFLVLHQNEKKVTVVLQLWVQVSSASLIRHTPDTQCMLVFFLQLVISPVFECTHVTLVATGLLFWPEPDLASHLHPSQSPGRPSGFASSHSRPTLAAAAL